MTEDNKNAHYELMKIEEEEFLSEESEIEIEEKDQYADPQ